MSKIAFAVLVPLFVISGCSSFVDDSKYSVRKSNIAAGENTSRVFNELPSESNPDAQAPKITTLNAFSETNNGLTRQKSAAERFSNTELVSFSSEAMPLKEFIDVLFSQILKTSYIITQNLPGLDEQVVLDIAEPVTQQRAFLLAADLLQAKGIDILEKEGIFYLLSVTPGSQGQTALGFGRKASDVPAANFVTQVVPLLFSSNGIESTISQLAKVTATKNTEQEILLVSGQRADVIKALDVVNMLDSASARGKFVSILKLTYLAPEEFTKKVKELMSGEGIDGIGISEAANKSLVLVPIEHMGAVAVFASKQQLVARVGYWAEQIDVAGGGPERRYFIYHPNYARAADLGASISPLIGGNAQTTGNQSRDTLSAMQSSPQPNADSGQSSSRNRVQEPTQTVSVVSERLTMTIDQRSNAMMFYTTGAEYQTILPMLKRLDVMPKQVLLEAVIAEVTLTDDFAMGVEFAIKNGKFGLNTTGAFGAANVGGLSASYINGAESILARMKQTNSLVNVLSNPSIVVRDGVVASIQVGSQIPTVSSSTTDPLLSDKTTTTITYTQTGLEFSVLPTINGQGLVVMQIQQNISNETSGSLVEGAPAIFKRTIETEVIAQSGQTVLIGGLISERDDSGDNKVPGLGDIPVLGNLFKSRTQNKRKTELVLLITPKVIDAAEQWDYINAQMQKGFKHLQIKE